MVCAIRPKTVSTDLINSLNHLDINFLPRDDT